MRWPAGPWTSTPREKKGFSAETAEVLRQWQDPASLSVVQGTPVNCLVVGWAAGLPADAGQQEALRPLHRERPAGRDWVRRPDRGGSQPATALAAANRRVFPLSPWTATRPQAPPSRYFRGANPPRCAGRRNPRPGYCGWLMARHPQERGQGGGPTNLPWVDSNGAVPSHRPGARADKACGSTSIRRAGILTAEAYMLAVADPASYGARWVISLDDKLRADLTANKQPAMDTWKKVAGMLAFFEQNQQARSYEAAGLLAVISNFAGSDWDSPVRRPSLVSRLRQSFRVIARSRAAGPPSPGCSRLLRRSRAPDADLRRKLVAFAKAWRHPFRAFQLAESGGPARAGRTILLFSLRALGKGRWQVCKRIGRRVRYGRGHQKHHESPERSAAPV